MSFYIRITAAELVVGNNCTTFISKPVNAAVVRARVRTHLTLKAQRDQLRDLAFVDGLTGIANRRHFDQALAHEWARAQRAHAPVSLIMLDVDHFKRFNDTHGHDAGDQVLAVFARTVAGYIRSTDILARWGGEEFVLLMVNTAADNGVALLERVRAAVQESVLVMATGASIRVTVSIGVAQLQTGHETPIGLLRRADEMLRAAGCKRDGNVLKTVSERYYPVKGQKFFLKGGVIDEPKYEYRGPETMPFEIGRASCRERVSSPV